jgi:hypothetical protein
LLLTDLSAKIYQRIAEPTKYRKGFEGSARNGNLFSKARNTGKTTKFVRSLTFRSLSRGN